MACGNGLFAFGYIFFHLLARLPEEEIRRDCCSEDRHENCKKLCVPLKPRCECTPQYFSPIRMSKECRTDVRQQGQCQPLENAGDAPVAAPDLDRGNQ